MGPRYLETVEDSLNNTANILASVVETELNGRPVEKKRLGRLRAALESAADRRFQARIRYRSKRSVDLHVYVVNAEGIVVYDSDGGKREGRDYSRWNDVYLTLRGRYGARATRVLENNPREGAYYVAAPIRYEGRILGVLTVIKNRSRTAPYIARARRKIIAAAAGTTALLLLLGLLITIWITWPLARLTAYVDSVRERRRDEPPPMGRTEIGRLARAFEKMRVELEGKQYVERYVQTLTHEIKSPLSSITAASELLEDEMPAEKRTSFIRNIRQGAARIGSLVERMLLLSSLENRRELKDAEPVELRELAAAVIREVESTALRKGITLELEPGPEVPARGEKFLLTQALSNLVNNALEFTPEQGTIRIAVVREEERAVLRVQDSGTGIPEYALPRIFERFYSLAREDGRRSSGLGLPFVREAAELHGGRVRVRNRAEGGVSAEIILPETG